MDLDSYARSTTWIAVGTVFAQDAVHLLTHNGHDLVQLLYEMGALQLLGLYCPALQQWRRKDSVLGQMPL